MGEEKKLAIKSNDFSYTRYQRILNYLEDMKNSYEINNKKDKLILQEIELLIDERIKNLKKVNIINYVCFIGIYFSFFSFFIKDLIFFTEFAILVNSIISITGTTIFLVGIYFCSWLKDLYYEDLSLLSGHAISIYEKNSFKKDNIFENIDIKSFFKKFNNKNN